MEKRGRKGRSFTEGRGLIEANTSPVYGAENLTGLKDGIKVLQPGSNKASVAAYGYRGKGLCIHEHNNLCCAAGKLFLTVKK